MSTWWPHVAMIPETTSRMGVCANCPGRPAKGQSAGAEAGTELRPCVGEVRRANSGTRGRCGVDALPSGPHGAPPVLSPPLAYGHLPVDLHQRLTGAPATHRCLGSSVFTLGLVSCGLLEASAGASVSQAGHKRSYDAWWSQSLDWRFPAVELP